MIPEAAYLPPGYRACTAEDELELMEFRTLKRKARAVRMVREYGFTVAETARRMDMAEDEVRANLRVYQTAADVWAHE